MDEENPRPLQGQHYLIGEILRSYVKQTLETDKQFTPFEYIGSEYRFNRPYRVNKELSVNFKGSIDRIDRKGERYRIIDYKTGTGETGFKDILQLFDASKITVPIRYCRCFCMGCFTIWKIRMQYFRLRCIIFARCSRILIQLLCAVITPLRIFPYICPNSEIILTLFWKKYLMLKFLLLKRRTKKNCQWCAFKRVCNR